MSIVLLAVVASATGCRATLAPTRATASEPAASSTTLYASPQRLSVSHLCFAEGRSAWAPIPRSRADRAGPSSLLLVDATVSPPDTGQEAGAASAGSSDLAKQSQNPVSDLVSVPFQFNLNTGIGPNDRDQLIVNIQPVIPIKLTKDWSLVTRTILPIIRQPLVNTETQTVAGIGDLNPTFFLTPAKPGKLIWGVGPSFLFPTATDRRLGTGKWAAGPGVVLLTMPGDWVVGVLASNLWSFAGDSDRADVNQFICQYFVNYNIPNSGGWYFTSSPIISANWEADADNQWTVPFGGGVGRIFKVGPQPINANIGAYYNVVRPDGGAQWQFRFQWTFLFP